MSILLLWILYDIFCTVCPVINLRWYCMSAGFLAFIFQRGTSCVFIQLTPDLCWNFPTLGSIVSKMNLHAKQRPPWSAASVNLHIFFLFLITLILPVFKDIAINSWNWDFHWCFQTISVMQQATAGTSCVQAYLFFLWRVCDYYKSAFIVI